MKNCQDLADFNEYNSEIKLGVLVGFHYYHSLFLT